MSEYHGVKIAINFVFGSKKDHNDKRNIVIKSEKSTDIDEIFGQLIQKHEDLTQYLKNIHLIPEGVESIVYKLGKTTKVNTFVETRECLSLKRCVINPQNNDNKCFQYAVTVALYHQQN